MATKLSDAEVRALGIRATASNATDAERDAFTRAIWPEYDARHPVKTEVVAEPAQGDVTFVKRTLHDHQTNQLMAMLGAASEAILSLNARVAVLEGKQAESPPLDKAITMLAKVMCAPVRPEHDAQGRLVGARRDVSDVLLDSSSSSPADKEARIAELEQRLDELASRPYLLHKGPWREGEVYPAGSTVSYGGSLWVAERVTSDRPSGPPSGWKLSVKGYR